MQDGFKRRWKWIVSLISCAVAAIVFWAGASANQTKVVYVFSESCGYCTTFTPTFEQVIREFPQWQVERLDVHDKRDLAEAERLGAEVTPTVFVVQGGEVAGKLEGAVSATAFRRFLQKHLTKPLSGKGNGE
ncbi:thioredoxin family protein [Brevibacillus sp. NL20B1]|jgi:thioredoxin 2|uniref:thioredoxin family protein n=1 Tax=Brevibacillus sp. NL20B1 TaxID=2829799 RepID=UPI001BA114D9|nr:thioredoxin family protein [Brevibacillus sp. NL20B1]MBR8659802.1 thioredoxin family protein [Brevibacillus sp. NL20B1]